MEAESGKVFAGLFREEPEEVDDMGGSASEELALFGALRRDAYGTGVAMTTPVLNAAERDE